MKIITLFLALATALFGQVADLTAQHKAIEPRDSAATTASTTDKRTLVTSGSLWIGGSTKADVTITTRHDIVWSADNAAGKLLSVNGITRIVPVLLTGHSNIWMTRQKAPEKPEEITVNLWTADGKKWVAKWEEVKP